MTQSNTQDPTLAILDDFAEQLKEIRDSAKEDYWYETHGMSEDIDKAYEEAQQELTSLITSEKEAAVQAVLKKLSDQSETLYWWTGGQYEKTTAVDMRAIAKLTQPHKEQE